MNDITHFNGIISSLISAIDYIESRTDEMDADDDVKALEEIGYHLQRLGSIEKEILIKWIKDNNRHELIDQFGIIE